MGPQPFSEAHLLGLIQGTGCLLQERDGARLQGFKVTYCTIVYGSIEEVLCDCLYPSVILCHTYTICYTLQLCCAV